MARYDKICSLMSTSLLPALAGRENIMIALNQSELWVHPFTNPKLLDIIFENWQTNKSTVDLVGILACHSSKNASTLESKPMRDLGHCLSDGESPLDQKMFALNLNWAVCWNSPRTCFERQDWGHRMRKDNLVANSISLDGCRGGGDDQHEPKCS